MHGVKKAKYLRLF